MSVTVAVLVASLSSQAANVLLAARLMRRTRNYLAGTIIISAVFLMVFRRGIALYRYASGNHFPTDLVAETVALVISFMMFIGILYATRLIESEIRSRTENEALIGRLTTALAEIKTLKGIIPICASCRRIRDDHGSWSVLERYVLEHSDAEFSHGICPDCAARLYPRGADPPGPEGAGTP